MRSLVPEPMPLADSCAHADGELLGFDTTAKFLRCNACRRILVIQGGRVWTLRPTPQRPTSVG